MFPTSHLFHLLPLFLNFNFVTFSHTRIKPKLILSLQSSTYKFTIQNLEKYINTFRSYTAVSGPKFEGWSASPRKLTLVDNSSHLLCYMSQRSVDTCLYAVWQFSAQYGTPR